MLFSSIPFLYYFLPAVLLSYFVLPLFLKHTVAPLIPKLSGKLTGGRWYASPAGFLTSVQNFILLVFSLGFYAWGEPKYVYLMIGTILLFYLCGMAIGFCKHLTWKRFWLVLSIVVSLALLAIFKYADFFISSFNAVTGLNMTLLRLALPIGISFYTFQCLSYTVDVYHGTADVQKNPINFGAYVALFPQLIAGPIVRYVDVARQLNHRTHNWDMFAKGLRRFLFGLAKKILIANQLGELTNLFRDSSEKSVLFYWMYAIAFSLHIYFDFSGYSDMAIGLGKIFGFDFIENFNYPYLSKSIGEFCISMGVESKVVSAVLKEITVDEQGNAKTDSLGLASKISDDDKKQIEEEMRKYYNDLSTTESEAKLKIISESLDALSILLDLDY